MRTKKRVEKILSLENVRILILITLSSAFKRVMVERERDGQVINCTIAALARSLFDFVTTTPTRVKVLIIEAFPVEEILY